MPTFLENSLGALKRGTQQKYGRAGGAALSNDPAMGAPAGEGDAAIAYAKSKMSPEEWALFQRAQDDSDPRNWIVQGNQKLFNPAPGMAEAQNKYTALVREYFNQGTKATATATATPSATAIPKETAPQGPQKGPTWLDTGMGATEAPETQGPQEGPTWLDVGMGTYPASTELNRVTTTGEPKNAPTVRLNPAAEPTGHEAAHAAQAAAPAPPPAYNPAYNWSPGVSGQSFAANPNFNPREPVSYNQGGNNALTNFFGRIFSGGGANDNVWKGNPTHAQVGPPAPVASNPEEGAPLGADGNSSYQTEAPTAHALLDMLGGKKPKAGSGDNYHARANPQLLAHFWRRFQGGGAAPIASNPEMGAPAGEDDSSYWYNPSRLRPTDLSANANVGTTTLPTTQSYAGNLQQFDNGSGANPQQTSNLVKDFGQGGGGGGGGGASGGNYTAVDPGTGSSYNVGSSPGAGESGPISAGGGAGGGLSGGQMADIGGAISGIVKAFYKNVPNFQFQQPQVNLPKPTYFTPPALSQNTNASF